MYLFFYNELVVFQLPAYVTLQIMLSVRNHFHELL